MFAYAVAQDIYNNMKYDLCSMCYPSIALEHDCYAIALACIYLAIRSAGASLSMDLGEVGSKASLS